MFAWDWSLSLPSQRADAVCVLNSGSFSLCCYSFLLPSSCFIPSLCFQTVAEVVKELEKNEKIRVQLECNKPAENVSADLGSHRGAQQSLQGGSEGLPVALLWEFPDCMLELTFSIL